MICHNPMRRYIIYIYIYIYFVHLIFKSTFKFIGPTNLMVDLKRMEMYKKYIRNVSVSFLMNF
jgi:hypothetical protein